MLINPKMSKLTAHALPRSLSYSGQQSAYLPIEAFRGHGSADLFQGTEITKTFRSSGTTSESRASSHFSTAGLAAYKQQSVATFLAVLDQVIPNGSKDSVGISLVPDELEWPDSSLAQMLAWIAQVVPVIYITAAELPETIERLKTKPLWLFGTAFHWLNALDAGQCKPLPRGSVVFETGGTKGKSREVSREQLFEEIAVGFSVPTTAIVSEYGMSELACQAYDFVPFGLSADLKNRWFRFTPGVKVGVLKAPGTIEAAGQGSLLIDDPLRVDYPWPIRTEDLATVGEQGFQLLGRAPIAPLKGCSLLAETANNLVLHTKGLATPGADVESARKYVRSEINETRSRIERLSVVLDNFVTTEETLALLSDELGSSSAAAAALEDLRLGLPSNQASWLQAAETATGTAPLARDWLFILPENHSLVGLYPLAMAYVLGLGVTVRIPRRFATGKNILLSFIASLKSLPGIEIATVAADWRLDGSTPQRGYGAVLCFGGNETIQSIQDNTNLPVQGFGHRIGVTILPFESIDTLADLVARDVLSLGQTGCMATRLVVTYQPPMSRKDATPGEAIERPARALQIAGSRFWGCELPWRQRVCLDAEAFRLRRTGADIWCPQSAYEPLMAWKELSSLDELDDLVLEQAIARSPFTMSVLSVQDSGPFRALERIVSLLGKSQSLGTITLPSDDLTQVEPAMANYWPKPPILRLLGLANSPYEDDRAEGFASRASIQRS